MIYVYLFFFRSDGAFTERRVSGIMGNPLTGSVRMGEGGGVFPTDRIRIINRVEVERFMVV